MEGIIDQENGVLVLFTHTSQVQWYTGRHITVKEEHGVTKDRMEEDIPHYMNVLKGKQDHEEGNYRKKRH